MFLVGSKCRFALFISCFLVGVLQAEVGAQLLPGFGWFDVSQLNVSPLNVGLFYGVGSIKAEHNLSAGPTSTPLWSVGGDFNAFVHHRKTELNDLYVSMESGLQRFGIEILNARVETNFGLVSKFKQITDPSALRRESNLLIFLEAGQEGVIIRDTKNRIWDIELSAKLPFTFLEDFLVGYKYYSVKSDINPYKSGTYFIPSPPSIPPFFFPGLPGWAPYVLDADNPPLPNSENFKMLETFGWHGPFIGVRFNNFFMGFEGSRGYLEAMWSPLVFGRYEFSWNTGFGGVFGSGRASQVTSVNKKLNSFVEIRAGARFPLIASFNCDVFLKYSYVSMKLSDLEYQSVDLEWPAFPAYNAIYSQQANQSINLRQDFFGAGASLVATF